jgi:hypothetical protein
LSENLARLARLVRLFVNHISLGFYSGVLPTQEFNVDKKNQLDVTFLFFISLLTVAQHVSGNHVPIIKS